MQAVVRMALTAELFASHSAGIAQRHDGTKPITMARPTPLRRAASRVALARTTSESGKRVAVLSSRYSDPFQKTKIVKSKRDCPFEVAAPRHDSTRSHA